MVSFPVFSLSQFVTLETQSLFFFWLIISPTMYFLLLKCYVAQLLRLVGITYPLSILLCLSDVHASKFRFAVLLLMYLL